MSDSDLMLADGFVRAVLEDNARLRAENDRVRAEAESVRLAASATRDKLERHIWRLVIKAGGEVEIKDGDLLYSGPRRLLIEDGDMGYFSGQWRYRALPETEMVAPAAGQILERRADA